MRVVIREIKETSCELYDELDIFVGRINSVLSLNDVRIQIMEQGLEGYHIRWMNTYDVPVNIPINRYGRLDNWPPGFFDEWDLQLEKFVEGGKNI